MICPHVCNPHKTSSRQNAFKIMTFCKKKKVWFHCVSPLYILRAQTDNAEHVDRNAAPADLYEYTDEMRRATHPERHRSAAKNSHTTPPPSGKRVLRQLGDGMCTKQTCELRPHTSVDQQAVHITASAMLTRIHMEPWMPSRLPSHTHTHTHTTARLSSFPHKILSFTPPPHQLKYDRESKTASAPVESIAWSLSPVHRCQRSAWCILFH